MIKIISGNILESKAYALVNTVNTVGIMGKGIALQFKNEFPHNYAVYQKAFINHELKIGHMLIVEDSSLHLGQRLIINFPSKTHWRLPSEYSFLEKGLEALKISINDKDITSIALPALGCGNGGLDWLVVRELIIANLSGLDADIEIYEPVH